MDGARTPDGSVAVLDAPSEATAPRRRWYAALDGWRGLAVLAVVAFHTGVLDGGWLGVDLFFVLSGFLITRVVLEDHHRAGRVHLWGFWRRRFRRLLPALLLVLVAVAILVALWPEPEELPGGLLAQALATLGYVANWQALASSSGYWDQYALESPLRHMWSLAIEEQFYVVFPLVVAAVLMWRKQALGWVFALLTVASWSAALALLATGSDFERVYLGTDTRVGAITLGALVGYLTTRPLVRKRLVVAARTLALPSVAVIITLLVLLDGDVAWSPQRWALVLLFEVAVAAVLVAGLSTGGATNRLVSVRWLVFFGAISYGLYLWHIPIQLVVERLAPDLPPVGLLVIVLGLSTVVAWCSWRLVEVPLRRDGLAALRRFRLPPRTGGVLLTGAAVSLTIVLIATTTAGLRQVGSQPSGFTSLNLPPPSSIAGAATTVAPVDGAAPTGETTGETVSLPLAAPSGRAPSVLLAGDSMALHLGERLPGMQDELGVVASLTSQVGCPAGGTNEIIGANGLDPGLVGECFTWLEELPSIAAQVQPDVIVMARASSIGREPGESPCDAGYLRRYREAVLAEADSLRAVTGAPVILTTVPYNRFIGRVREEEDRRADCVNAELAAMAGTGAVGLVDLGGWVCPTRDGCLEVLDGVRLRFDGLHFRDEGAEVALRWMFDRIYGPGR